MEGIFFQQTSNSTLTRQHEHSMTVNEYKYKKRAMMFPKYSNVSCTSCYKRFESIFKLQKEN